MKRTIAVILMACCLTVAAAESLTPEELAKVRAGEAARIAAIGKVYGAVVAIYGMNVARGGGSGVLFDPDGFALTNYHVVRAAGRQGKAGLADGKLYDWKLYGIDPGGDLAIIRLSGRKRFPVAELGDSGTVRVGDWAMAMGNPFNLAEDQKPTVTLGIVSGIERFQPGQGGGRTLVYGNCIQVDSSINPGNSGGPLFDLSGQLLGINGRGSFEERGRVNVGIGYAVSVEQAKNFLPDLLATKTCEHGTLDATFYNDSETGTVRCNAVNDEADIAKAGMRPNDHLVAFDGTPIRSGNQYLSLVSTCPAGWPVSVTYRRGEEERTVWVRLRKLPYNLQQPRPPVQPRIVPKKKDDGKKPEGRKDDQKPASPRPAPVVPGKIADQALNRQECSRLIGRCASFLGKRDGVQGLQCEEAVVEGGKPVGKRRVLLAMDGRFRVEVLEACGGIPAGASWGFDGKQLWRRQPGQKAAAEEGAKSFPVALARALAACLGKEPVKAFKAAELEGGDRAQGQRAFRLRVEDEAGGKLLLWLSLFGEGTRLETRLLKAARDSSEKGADSAWTFSDYRSVGGIRFPHRRREVRGLDERVIREFVATSAKTLDKLPEAAFEAPDGK